MINNILQENSCATVNSSVTEILSGGNIIRDSQEIVSQFNDFFVNIGPDLAKKITPGNPNTSITDTMPTPNSTSFSLHLALAMKYKQWLRTYQIAVVLELIDFQ